MKDVQSQWIEIKNEYLALVAQALMGVEYQKRSWILNQVAEHLDQKYSELPPEKRNWESFRQLVTEMGPAEEYAALMGVNMPKIRLPNREFHKLWVAVLILAAGAAGVWLIINGPGLLPENKPQSRPIIVQPFQPDSRVLGQWLTIDFVKTIDAFSPAKKTGQGELFLNSLDFKDQGRVEWSTGQMEDKSNGWWTSGKLDPNNPIPSLYDIRAIDGNDYLFVEWIGGDVMLHGQKPSYYVLARDPQKVPFNMPVVMDKKEEPPVQSQPQPQPIIETLPVVVAPQPVEAGVFIIRFRAKESAGIQDSQKLLNAFNQNCPKEAPTHHYRTQKEENRLIGYICTDSQAGVQAIRQMLEKSDTLEILNVIGVTQAEFETYRQSGPTFLTESKTKEQAAEPAIYGKWLAVGYVRKADDFVPGRQQWTKKMLLREMRFAAPSTAFWTFTTNVTKQTTFGDLTVQSVNDYAAKYFRKTIEQQEYLFVEWTTLEVIEKKQMPWVYVLKRETVEPADQPAAAQPVQAAAVIESPDVLGKWTAVDFVREMDNFDPGKKFWQGEIFLTVLEFQPKRLVWCSFNNNQRTKYPWTAGSVNVGPRPAHYVVKEIGGSQYMFFEWINHDVTSRGQKPAYYVLKKSR
jgi:hypothetical protein